MTGTSRTRSLAALLIPLAIPLLLPACAGAPSVAQAAHDAGEIRQKIMAHYRRWKGTPYRFGGESRRGVDCSGFVHVTFARALGIEVPRSTELLSRIRRRVPRARLNVGDILIFRIDRRTLHAGIYVGDGRFVHASKSRGVTLSRLGNPYWREVYDRAVRVAI